jgi:outer membrane protein assembly factor BamB
MFALTMSAATAVSGQQSRNVKEKEPAPLLPAQQAWSVALSVPPAAGGAMDSARVYVPLESEQLLALHRETGRVAWIADIDTTWPPVAMDGAVFVAANDEVHALDAATGRRRWRAAIAQSPAASMGYASGTLIVPTASNEILAFAALDGRLIWKYPLGTALRPSALTVAPGVVYLSLEGSRVVSLSVADGRVLWTRTLDGTLTVPAVATGLVIVGSTNNSFYALDAGSGAIKWTWPTGADAVGAAADEGLVFLTALDNTLKAVGRGNANQRWRLTVPTRPIGPPRAFGGTVVVVGLSPTLSTFVARSGEPAGTYDAAAELEGPPLIDPILRAFSVAMVLITRDGQVLGLRPQEMLFREAAATPLPALPGRPLTREPATAAARPR